MAPELLNPGNGFNEDGKVWRSIPIFGVPLEKAQC